MKITPDKWGYRNGGPWAIRIKKPHSDTRTYRDLAEDWWNEVLRNILAVG
jgi:hypothetical protein